MPEAPYPANTSAKGWRFELDMARVRQSDTWALCHAEARPWLMLLWAVAWEQTPCGSLPAEDALIVARLEIPARLWAKHREVLLRGWWLADDGRLYHNTLAERVREMVGHKERERARKADYRARQSVPQQSSEDVPRDRRGTDKGVPRESATGTGTRTGEIQEEATPLPDSAAPTRAAPCPVSEIVDAYHRRLPMLPRCMVVSESRRRSIAARWREVIHDPEIRRSPDPRRAALEWFDWLFGYAAESRFLTGRAKDWRADIDFLMDPQKFARLVEGNYHKEAA